MEGNNLLWLIVFNVTTFLFASVVYRTNLNIRRRIETDAVADERQHAKRELHDGIVQTIGYLSLKTQTVSALVAAGDKAKALEGLDEMHETVQDAYRDARETLDQLSIEIGEAELVQTLKDYVDSFSERYSIQVSLEAPSEEVQLTPLASLQILRVTQEALTMSASTPKPQRPGSFFNPMEKDLISSSEITAAVLTLRALPPMARGTTDCRSSAGGPKVLVAS